MNTFDNFQALADISNELKYLSTSLYAVGNQTLAKKLSTLSADINTINIAIQREAAEELNKRIAISDQSTLNMVNAAISGVALGKGYTKN